MYKAKRRRRGGWKQESSDKTGAIIEARQWRLGDDMCRWNHVKSTAACSLPRLSRRYYQCQQGIS